MKSLKTLEVTLPSDTEIKMVRAFDAPRRLVHRAMSEPALMARWIGGKHTEVVKIENDLRIGGAYRQEFKNGDGSTFFFIGTYSEVGEERVVHTELFNGEPPPAIVETTLVEVGGRTTMTVIMKFPDKAVRDMVVQTGMSEGAGKSYDVLAELLTAL